MTWPGYEMGVVVVNANVRVGRGVWLMAAAMALAANAVGAADYPSRTVKVVVPFAAAGVTDIVARVVFDKVGSGARAKTISMHYKASDGLVYVLKPDQTSGLKVEVKPLEKVR